MEEPNKFLVIKITKKDEKQFYKVFATLFGGYLDGDYWKMNSGIEKIEIEDEMINFIGYSGSIYQCHQNSYGANFYTQSVLGERPIHSVADGWASTHHARAIAPR